MKLKKWYQDISLKDARAFVKSNISSAARSFIATGFYLICKEQRDIGYGGKEKTRGELW